jgi:cell division protein FtsB
LCAFLWQDVYRLKAQVKKRDMEIDGLKTQIADLEAQVVQLREGNVAAQPGGEPRCVYYIDTHCFHTGGLLPGVLVQAS